MLRRPSFSAPAFAAALLSCVFTFGADQARACTKAKVSVRARTMSPEPFSPNVTAEPLLVAVQAGPDEACKGVLLLRRPMARGQKAPGVFSISRSAASADKLTGEDQALDEVQVIPVDLEAGKSTALQLFTLFQYEQGPGTVKAGSYMYNLDFFVRVAEGRQEALSTRGARVLIPARTTVRTALTKSTYDVAGASTDVNFDELEEGEVRRFYLIARSTAPFRFSVSSENGWRLKRTGAETGEDTLVDYTLQTGGGAAVASPGSPRTVNFTPVDAGATGYDGAAFPAEARIGSVERKRAGDYVDVLTVTASAER